jgi:hypothetical protein
MLSLDLFNTKYERELTEGAVDNLEARRIDDLNEKMQDLLARARTANPEMKAALKREFDKVKEERDSYYHVKEDGIGQDVVNKTEKMARATPSTPTGKVASTVKNAAKWLAGKGGPGKEGPTYEGQIQKKNSKEIDEGRMAELDAMRQDLERMNERQFYTAYGMSKAAFQQKYRTLLKPATLDESQRLHQGDPIVVTGPNEFEGKTGEIEEFSPSGAFVIVNLYNHGRHSMHLSDITYNEYADQEQDEEDDWYDDEEVDEGWQDFNKVEPYAVCLAGKPIKKFDYYEQARRFHDNWKQKLYREGNKEKADKITLMPLNLDEEEQKPPGWGEFPPKQEITILPFKKLKSGETYQDQNKYWQSQGQAPIYKTNEVKADPTGSWVVYNGSRVKRFKTHGGANAYAKKSGGKVASSEFYQDKIQKQGVAEVYTPSPAKPPRSPRGFNKQGTGLGNKLADLNRKEWEEKKKKEQGVTEGQTDYQKRRQRERDIDAGKPVAKQRQPKMTDYQKRRAQDRKDMALGEQLTDDVDTSPVVQAILKRIMVAHKDLLAKFGPEKIMTAAEDVAYNVGDFQDIGSSDVSQFVHQVKQILGAEA